MVDVFEQKICNYCKNENCNKEIIKNYSNEMISYKCNNYLKDQSKIVPYEKPLYVTAEREYICLIER